MSDDIIDVWDYNCEEEMHKISHLVEHFHFVGMDTEFSGFFIKSPPVTATPTVKYLTERENVNRMKLIQIGITLGDENGNIPKPICTWQFNLRFNIKNDMHTSDSINLLKQAGIDFDKFEKDGIEMADFVSMLIASGLVMNDRVIWITFQAGYDIAYLVKLLSAQPLPKTEAEFEKVTRLYFPHYYDLRYIMQQTIHNVGSLQNVAKDFDVVRSGTMHQAGSDSYVTLLSYYKAMAKHFGGVLLNERYRNKGLK
ncbi:CAF1 family ribonuclease containing protein [Trichomonas vaginalis G3]|uniref:poly(A)-specific ribonuclease n=1 Tax=Trichomonas vaginalis (strain ATCC PRA-98 / G3) TaxID=412133 RepID=A2E832_TRIV3|nr:exonucleolytic nuclear-transcribed mRNA catabolic process involved in deadenylation-dependent decay [Trichomonas vaginalis G3]EAY11150.1 CAF1 family ribonuclease containing protein [Trichomonas vaginalis G3]KAI5488784.1 exonucleolytic nuclear-transcribed mRNA catabolic process involved in deadenylation-dependent decay [Trichomonas vaginalis G3]|eukprot:XP_001323373.1 CAF1 family ribonuclease containing protein [Trichomonas vaginalis G3]